MSDEPAWLVSKRYDSGMKQVVFWEEIILRDIRDMRLVYKRRVRDGDSLSELL